MNDARANVSIDFFADLSCPWCYLGWEALKRAAANKRDAYSVSVSWRTFLLAPDAPREGHDRADYLSKYTSEQRAASAAALAEAASGLDLALNLDAITRIPNTIDAHRLIHWVSDLDAAEALIDALFAAHFVHARDIGTANVLVDCAECVGVDASEFASKLDHHDDREHIRDLHRAAVDAGVKGVPVAILNRKHPLLGAQSPAQYEDAFAKAVAK